MIQLKKLTKSYKTKVGRNWVLKDVTLDIPEENVAILGPNGSGKSTLLKIIGGIDYPDCGTLECHKTISWPLGLKSGFIRDLSAKENCSLILQLHGLDHRLIKKKLSLIKEIAGIGNYFDEPVKYFSSGMASRIGFALSMAFEFEILLMDEITAVGDQDFQIHAKNILGEKRKKTNIIFVSHSLVSMRSFCDSGIIIKDGNLDYYEKIGDAIDTYVKKET